MNLFEKLGCIAIFAIVAAPGLAAEIDGDAAGLAYATIDIDGIGYAALEGLQSSEAILWWVEADDRLLVLVRPEDLPALSGGRSVEALDLPVARDDLAFVQGGHRSEIEALGPSVEVLVRAGGTAVVQTTLDLVLADPAVPRGRGMRFLPFAPNTVLARQWANTQGARRRLPEPDALVRDLVDQVDPDRWLAAVTSLAGFNRYTHALGIHAARDWLIAQFDDLPGLDVTTQSFQVGGTTAYNVIATWTGTGRPDDWVLVGGHYDATSENPTVAAPGAEDNASGCAGVLEMARILADHAPPATVIYLCYSGEEQGLLGSEAHAASLVAAGNDDKVQAMLNMDMIGYTGDADLDCRLETSSSYAYLFDVFGQAAARYTTLRIVTDTSPGGSDHVPYILEGMPALLTIENDWWSYPHYHRTTDLPQHLSLEMGGEILRMNVAVLADLTGVADGDLVFSDGFESGDASAWR